jgi:hypothetical protein
VFNVTMVEYNGALVMTIGGRGPYLSWAAVGNSSIFQICIASGCRRKAAMRVVGLDRANAAYPTGSIDCETDYLVALNRQYVHFKLDSTQQQATGFSIPGWMYGYDFLRTDQ